MLSLRENIVVNKQNIVGYLDQEIMRGTLEHNDVITNEIDLAPNSGAVFCINMQVSFYPNSALWQGN